MSLPYTQNFDGVPGSSLPGGFNQTGGTWSVTGTDNSIVPTSSPNMLRIATSSATKAYLTYGTADGNGGDLTLKVDLNDFSSVRPGYVGVAARGSAPTLDGTTSQYEVLLNWNTGDLALTRVNSGTATTLATVSIVGGWDQWDTLTWTLAGSSHKVALQRSSDNEWLTAGGSWQVAQTNAISYTDSSPLTGSGYFAFATKAGASSSHSGYWDGFSATANGTVLALAEGHDTPSFSTTVRTPASLAKTEGRDAASIAGTCTAGSLAKTEGRDTPSVSGGGGSGSMAAAERRDTAALAGSTPNAILSIQERPDAPSFAATATAVGAFTPTESADVPSLFAAQKHGILAAAERHDTASIAGRSSIPGSLAKAEGRDVPAFAGLSVHAALAIAEARDRAAIPAVAAGIPPYFKVQERGDIPALFGGQPTVRYHVYASPAAGAPIDYTTPIATVDASPYVPPPVAVPGAWSWGVRAFGLGGEEQNVDCVVRVTFDADGVDVSNRPNPPAGLRAFPTGATAGPPTTAGLLLESGSGLLLESGDRVATEAGSSSASTSALARVEWHYPPTPGPKAPSGFNVYLGTGGAPDYAAPFAAVAYSDGLFGAFHCDLTGLVGGTTYSVSVRATNAAGEEQNTRVATFTASGGGPLAVVGLVATATV